MEVNESVTVSPEQSIPVHDDACPRCDEPWEPMPTVEAKVLGQVRIRRCARCGARATVDESPPRMMFSCDGCGQPFLESRILPHGSQRCPSCMEAQAPAVQPDPDAAAASESETRTALDAEWRFVSCRALSPYLDGIVARLASTMEGLPTGECVALLDDPRLRTLALPSGTVIISIGMLQFLEDEAELAFVLGHELAHIASGAVASRMVRGGLAAVANEDRLEENGWGDAATDLIRLGYGRRREQEADARALDAILSLQYDPESAIRFLGRLRVAAESSVPEVAETYVAHPAPSYRVRKLERSLYGRVERDHVLRVNREVFRRAIRAASTGQLTETKLSGGKTAESAPRWSVSPWLIWTAAAAATVGLVATVLHLLS